MKIPCRRINDLNVCDVFNTAWCKLKIGVVDELRPQQSIRLRLHSAMWAARVVPLRRSK